MIRLVLVDDQAAVRQGLRMRLLLEPDIAVIGEASSGKEALALVQQLCPDVVLMDIEMPDMDGISAAALVRTIAPQSVVVMLSIHDESMIRAQALRAGARAFVEKCGSMESLLAAIRSVTSQA